MPPRNDSIVMTGSAIHLNSDEKAQPALRQTATNFGDSTSAAIKELIESSISKDMQLQDHNMELAAPL